MQPGAPVIPRHVAIIMDGNGRWAKSRGLPRIRGHHVGADSVRAILLACRKIGVEYLTLYAFSSENWIRPRAEVSGLMSLLRRFLRQQAHELHEHKVRLRVIGHIQDLPDGVRKAQAGKPNVVRPQKAAAAPAVTPQQQRAKPVDVAAKPPATKPREKHLAAN